MIIGFVKGQELSLQAPTVVSDSVDYLEMQFMFLTKDWVSADAWVHISKGAESYEIQLLEGKVTKEKHLNLSAGDWSVCLHGTVGKTRITTQCSTLSVQQSCIKDGTVFPDVPLEPLEQVSQTANAAMALAEDNKRRLDAGGGGGGGTGGVSQQYVDEQDAATLAAAKAHANAQADEALMDAMEYTDNQIKLVPKPDVTKAYVDEQDRAAAQSVDAKLQGYLKSTDISAWAKQPTKPAYTAQEVGALSDDTVIPDVPAWALEPQKPTYTAKDVGALPSSTKIPTKTSELQNDSGFLTEHQSLENYAKKTELPTKTSELTNDSGFLTTPYGIEVEVSDSHEIKPNIFCAFQGTHANVNITLAPSSTYAEYNFSFTASSDGCNLSIPDFVKWDGGKPPTLEASKKYEVSIMGAVAVISQGVVM